MKLFICLLSRWKYCSENREPTYFKKLFSVTYFQCICFIQVHIHFDAIKNGTEKSLCVFKIFHQCFTKVVWILRILKIWTPSDAWSIVSTVQVCRFHKKKKRNRNENAAFLSTCFIFTEVFFLRVAQCSEMYCSNLGLDTLWTLHYKIFFSLF